VKLNQESLQVLDIITKAQFDDAIKRYKSGPIADAIGILKSPSKDGRILGGASQIVIYKTNASIKAEKTLNVAKVLAKNWGVDGNDISISIVEGAIVDAQASITGTIDETFSITAGDTLILNIAGAAYTYTAPATVPASSAADMVTALGNAPDWSPSLPILPEVDNSTKVKISVLASLVENDESYIDVDATSTLDTILGIVGSNRGNKGSRIMSVKQGLVTESSSDVGGADIMSVQYSGTGAFCKLSVKKIGGVLTLTTDTGVPAEDLSIDLEDAGGLPIKTFQALIDMIDADANYSASLIDVASGLQNAVQLDYYTDIHCKDVAVVLHKDMYLLLDEMNAKSEIIEIELPNPAIMGAIEKFSAKQFLTGGARGSSANSDFLAGFEALKAVRVNIALPLVSEDVGGLSVDAINAMADNYAAEGWTTGGKSERNVYVSKLGTKDEFKLAAQTLQSEFCSILGQDVRVLNSQGDLTWLDPWAHAAIYAGMQAGGDAGEPLTLKVINANDIRVRDNSWNPLVDQTEMVNAGCSVSRKIDTGGFEIVVANTTYSVDGNWMKNRTNVMEAAAHLLYDLRFQLEKQFAGTKARTGGEEEVKNFVKARAEVYLDDELNRWKR